MEDLNGVPFCGASGKLLNELLQIAGLRRGEVYVTNIVKCRPPGNRVPSEDEIEICTSNFLRKQISIIRPKLVVTLGRTSVKALMGREFTMGLEHGNKLMCNYGGVSFELFVSYHPAASLYGAKAKSNLQKDFAKLAKILKSLKLP